MAIHYGWFKAEKCYLPRCSDSLFVLFKVRQSCLHMFSVISIHVGDCWNQILGLKNSDMSEIFLPLWTQFPANSGKVWEQMWGR